LTPIGKAATPNCSAKPHKTSVTTWGI